VSSKKDENRQYMGKYKAIHYRRTSGQPKKGRCNNVQQRIKNIKNKNVNKREINKNVR